MALAVTTDLVRLTDAEAYASPPWYKIGVTAPVTEPDFYVQGYNCISLGISAAATKGMVLDYGSGIDFTSGAHKDKLIYIWMKSNTPGLCATRVNGGMRVRLCTTSPTADFREWYVDGSDTLVAIEGWICYVIDPQSAGTATTGSYSAASVRYFGGTMTTVASAKGQNLGIDAIYYGRGELYVSGAVATAGQGFKEIADADYGTPVNRYGIITVKQGIIFVKGKIIIGHATANTVFSSYNETVIYETPSYKSATNVVKSIPDASVGGTVGADGLTSYNGLAFVGGSGTTSIDFGVIVGTDSGRSGTSFNCVTNSGLTTPAKTLATICASDAAMAFSIYGSNFIGFEGTVDLYGTNLTGDDCFANTFNGCGQIRSNMEMRNLNILNSLVTTGGYLWESTSNITKSLFVNNVRGIEHPSATGSPFSYDTLIFSGNGFDINNTSGQAITIGKNNGANPSTYTGSAVTFTGSVTLTITVKDEAGNPIVGAFAFIDQSPPESPYIMNTQTVAGGIATVGWTGGPVIGSTWRVRKYGYKNYKQSIDIGEVNISIPVTLVVDPQQT